MVGNPPRRYLRSLSVACALAGATLFAGPPLASAAVVNGSVGAKTPCVYSSHHISLLDEFGSAIGRSIQCAMVFNDSAPTWATWEKPWFLNSNPVDQQWLQWATAPSTQRTLVITQNLFPGSENNNNWLANGAAGVYEPYAVQLATNLVAAGLGNSVIRLAHEANGNWYKDSIPDTTTGDQQWIQFWRNTVTAMRSVPGANFTFDWTINAGYRRIPLTEWYPGDDVVDIVGIDAYDAGVPTNVTFAQRWNYLYNQQDGLGAVEAFAVAHNKPVSIPEWGLGPAQEPGKGQGGDDPAFVNGIASMVANDNVAYQSYFDSGEQHMQLYNSPNSLQAMQTDFGPSGTAIAPADQGAQTLVANPAPALSITDGPADASTLTTNTATFGFAVQSGYTAQCSLDGQAWRACSTAGTDVLSNLSTGYHRWNVQVTSSAQQVRLYGRAFVVTAPPATTTTTTAAVNLG